MTSRQLDEIQVKKIAAAISRMSSYMSKLTGRMSQKGFPHNDPLRVTADRVFAAVQEMETALRMLGRTGP